MNQYDDNSDVDEIIRKAQALAADISDGTGDLDSEVFKPIAIAEAAAANVEAEYDEAEADLIESNEQMLADNERAVAEASARANTLLADDSSK